METMPTKESEKALIDDMMSSVQGRSHEAWRETRREADGSFNPRLKPLDPLRDKAWMEAHPELIEDHYVDHVDIANLSFDELPPSHQEDTKESLRYAFESVLRAARNDTPHDDAFINATADTIHERWILRNHERVNQEISDLMEMGGAKNHMEAERRKNQLLPYSQLATDDERELDRKFVRIALEEYQKRQTA